MNLTRHGLRAIAAGLVVGLLTPTGLSGGETGATITGRIMFRGAVPAPKMMPVDLDTEICGKTVTVSSLVVDVSTHGVREAVVSVEGAGSSSVQAPSAAAIVNQNCAFSPRIAGAALGQTIEVLNQDPVMHNTHVTHDEKTFLNVAQVPGGRPIRKLFKKGGIHHIKCDVHKFMEGYVVVFEHPHFTVSGRNGEFRLPDIPPGPRELTVWHEALGPVHKTVVVPPKGELVVNVEYP